ncbi:membrane protein [Marinobacter szutsaonensis]
MIDLALLSVPVMAAVTGWVTNWLAIQMSFYPVRFVGFGVIGWQGVIPRKAEKMAHICIDHTLQKFGDLNSVYEKLEPQRIVEQVISQVTPRVDEYIDEIMYENHPVLWDNVPLFVRNRIYKWAREALPERVEELVEDFGDDLDELVDLKALLSRELQRHPDLMNRIFKQAGSVELQSVINLGAIIGGLLGAALVPLWVRYPEPWLLPLGGFAVGFLTNWLAINLIFTPVEPRRFLFWKIQGLFLRRQPEISEVWARLVAEELITVERVADAMINGAHGDRTRAIIQKHLRPLLDSSPVMKLTAQVSVGVTGYTELKKALYQKAVVATGDVFSDPAFNRERAPVVTEVLAGQMKSLGPREFQGILRPAFHEEELQLMIVGGVFGALAGLIQFLSLTYLVL